MSAATPTELAPPADVSDFLRQHHADAAFAKVIALVEACYPQVVRLGLGLQEDPDEPGRCKVVLDAYLPAATEIEDIVDQERACYDRLVREIPLAQCPLFAVRVSFAE